MTTKQELIDQLSTMIDRENARRAPWDDDARSDIIGWQVAGRDPHVTIELAQHPFHRCEGCREVLDVRRPRVKCFDNLGDPEGIWSHQHGCGTVNTPVGVSSRIDLESDDWQTAVAGLLHDLDREVADVRSDALQECFDRLRALGVPDDTSSPTWQSSTSSSAPKTSIPMTSQASSLNGKACAGERRPRVSSRPSTPITRRCGWCRRHRRSSRSAARHGTTMAETWIVAATGTGGFRPAGVAVGNDPPMGGINRTDNNRERGMNHGSMESSGALPRLRRQSAHPSRSFQRPSEDRAAMPMVRRRVHW